MRYDDKEERLARAKQHVDCCVGALHPTDRAEALREIEQHAGKRAAEQEETNDRDGVPER